MLKTKEVYIYFDHGHGGLNVDADVMTLVSRRSAYKRDVSIFSFYFSENGFTWYVCFGVLRNE